MKRSLLSIAGFDPTCGSGISQDARLFSALDWHPLAVPMVLVAQDSVHVRRVKAIDEQSFSAMLNLLAEDFDIAGVKLGLLGGSTAMVKSLATFLQDLRAKHWVPVVWDPIWRSSFGAPLQEAGTLNLLRRFVLPHVDLITPNLSEFALWMNTSTEQAKEVELWLPECFARYAVKVLLKGVGSSEQSGRISDWLYDGQQLKQFVGVDLPTARLAGVHGSGCAFSCLLVHGMAAGLSLHEAITSAKEKTQQLLEGSYTPAKSNRPFVQVALL